MKVTHEKRHDAFKPFSIKILFETKEEVELFTDIMDEEIPDTSRAKARTKADEMIESIKLEMTKAQNP